MPAETSNHFLANSLNKKLISDPCLSLMYVRTLSSLLSAFPIRPCSTGPPPNEAIMAVSYGCKDGIYTHKMYNYVCIYICMYFTGILAYIYTIFSFVCTYISLHVDNHT